MNKPYYTSNSLIEAIERKIAVPLTHVTFSKQDILNFAYEELMLEQVPSILQYHEEYLVYKVRKSLLPNTSKYSIPDRAIGMRLRDVFYVDTQGQLCQMSRISPDDKNFYEVSSGTSYYPIFYYIENNAIVMVPEVQASPVGELEISFFLRPNALVPDEEAAISQSFSKEILVNSFSNPADLNGTVISIGSLNITAGVDFPIGVNSSATALNLTSYINNLNNPDLTASNNNNICAVFYYSRSLKFSSTDPNLFSIQKTITVNCPNIPSKITDRSMVDLLQTDGGHSTLAYDVLLGQNVVSQTSITFTEEQLPSEFIIGDYICARYECIIPQIPTDLHPLLAERACSRILSSLGDNDSMALADNKINRLESRQTIIMDNRVDGAPLKVTSFNGLLRNTRTGFRGRRR